MQDKGIEHRFELLCPIHPIHRFIDDLYTCLPLLSPWRQPFTWRVRAEAEAAALMIRSSHGQLVVDSLRSLRAASSGIAAVAEGAAGAGSGSRISYRDRRNCKTHEAKYFILFKC